MGGKKDRFDEYGQADGYDVNLARQKSLEHAQNELATKVDWLKGLRLTWEVEDAHYDEDAECYKVVLLGYPAEGKIKSKSRWEYHIDAEGNLLIGTPMLRERGNWSMGSGKKKLWIGVISVVLIALVAAGAIWFFVFGFDEEDRAGTTSNAPAKTSSAEQYTLSVSSSPSSGGYVSPSGGTYDEEISVSLTAHPYSGYTFDHWGGSASGYSSSTSVTMNSNKSVTAYFEEIQPEQYTLSVSSSPSSGGYVSPSGGTYDDGASVTLTAHPYSGYTFDHWGGSASGYSSSTSVTMNSDKSVTAYFEEIQPEQYTLSVSSSPSSGGDVSPSGGTYDEGASVTLTAHPYSGYTFDHWGGSASGYSSSTSVTMNSNKSVTAYFEEIQPEQYTLSVSSSPSSGGYVSPSGGTYDEGASVTLTAYPNSGYEFDHWGGSASGYSSSTSVTMNSNKSVVAYFEKSTQHIEYTLDGGFMSSQWVSWSKWLNSGDKVTGSLQISGYYPSISLSEWDSTCWFDVFDQGNDIIYSWQSEFQEGGISHEFEFTAPSSGQYDIQVKHGSNYDRDIVIDISPDGWS